MVTHPILNLELKHVAARMLLGFPAFAWDNYIPRIQSWDGDFRWLRWSLAEVVNRSDVLCKPFTHVLFTCLLMTAHSTL